MLIKIFRLLVFYTNMMKKAWELLFYHVYNILNGILIAGPLNAPFLVFTPLFVWYSSFEVSIGLILDGRLEMACIQYTISSRAALGLPALGLPRSAYL